MSDESEKIAFSDSDDFKFKEQEDSSDPLAARVRPRKCPACGAPVRRYFLTGLYMPAETHFMQTLTKTPGEMPMVAPVAAQSDHELFEMCFRTHCECGFLGLWNLSASEMNAIIRDENKSRDGLFVMWQYAPSTLERFRAFVMSQPRSDLMLKFRTALRMLEGMADAHEKFVAKGID